jgi:hypothetical protein
LLYFQPIQRASIHVHPYLEWSNLFFHPSLFTWTQSATVSNRLKSDHSPFGGLWVAGRGLRVRDYCFGPMAGDSPTCDNFSPIHLLTHLCGVSDGRKPPEMLYDLIPHYYSAV